MTSKIKLLIFGAGGHGRSVAEAATLNGRFQVVGFLDDGIAASETVMGYPVFGSLSGFPATCQTYDQVVVAIGNNRLRESLVSQLTQAGIALATVVHPRAFVSPSASLGLGTVVMAGAMIGTEANVGAGVIVNTGAVVDHHAQVDDYGHLGVQASMAGCSKLGHGAWLQAGAALGYGVFVSPGLVLKPGQGADASWHSFESTAVV